MVLGEISISGTMMKVDELANALQICLDSGAKKVLLPSTSFVDFATVPPELMSAFQLIPYQSAEDYDYEFNFYDEDEIRQEVNDLLKMIGNMQK